MTLTRSQMLARIRARDRASDGRFLSGVLTTGIYCLPSCTARPPNEENVRFFADEASARKVGLRPCKRCRPDRFHAGLDPEVDLAHEAARIAREEPGELAGPAALARRLGIGATKLGRLARRHFHASPSELVLRGRAARAARELLETDRRIVDVALDCGWESSSAFHEGFRRATAMTPRAYRDLRRGPRFALELPGGYRREDALAQQGRFRASLLERRDDGRFHRALLLAGRPAVLSVDLSGARAHCRVESATPPSARAMAQAQEVARRLLGLQWNPAPFERRHAALVGRRRGLHVPQTADAFEGVVWTLVGQQVNLAFAFACRNVVAELAGRPVAGGWRAHPTPAAVARLDYADLTRRKFSRRKAEYLIDTAREVESGRLDLDALARSSVVHAERALLRVRGMGPWTVSYLSMRSFGFVDCVPVGDAGLVASLARFFGLGARPDAARTVSLMEPFAPHRSLATFHLWRRLGDAE